MRDSINPHAQAAYQEWVAMRSTVDAKPLVSLDGKNLSIGGVIAVSW